MAGNLIRWKRSDYMKLSKAISKFNKEVSKLQDEGFKNLPDLKNYKAIKGSIFTRKELNRLIKSMKKFNIDTAKSVELDNGLKMTKWEYKELVNARTRARHNLENKLEILEKENPYVKYGIDTKEIEMTKASIKSLDKLETKAQGFELNRLKERINRLGSYDEQMRKAVIYKQNYMEALEQMSNYDNFDLLKDKLEGINNPEQFYELIQKSPTLSDLFDYYNDNPEAQTIAGFSNNQEAFNRALQELGILDEDYVTLEYDLTDLSSTISHIE